MKFLKIAFAAVFAFAFGNAYAFHSGGVAECEGCHTMHNSLESKAMGAGTQYAAGPYLLKGSDQSSTCLECHSETPLGNGYHIMDNTHTYGTNDTFAPGNFTPGGDFAWVKKSWTWVPRTGAATETSLAERHGHNVVAADFGIAADAANTQSPGGGYPASALACSSCHDPHGKYRRNAAGVIATTGQPIKASGSYYNTKSGVSANEPDTNFSVGTYRLLGGVGYQPKSVATSAPAFVNTVPVAKVNSTYNDSLGESAVQYRVAYGSGMSEWCANCHASMHRPAYTSGKAGLSHPAGNGAVLGAIAGNYNSYVKTGDLSGTQATSGTTLVPFEMASTDYAAMALLAVNTATFAGPDTTSNVSCMSCHRAHATAFDSMTRFGIMNEFMTQADTAGAPIWPATPQSGAASGRTTAEISAAYYLRPVTQFAGYQRVLCNKCHVKD